MSEVAICHRYADFEWGDNHAIFNISFVLFTVEKGQRNIDLSEFSTCWGRKYVLQESFAFHGNAHTRFRVSLGTIVLGTQGYAVVLFKMAVNWLSHIMQSYYLSTRSQNHVTPSRLILYTEETISRKLLLIHVVLVLIQWSKIKTA